MELEDPVGFSIGKKIVHHGKRLCVVLAGVALTLSAFDLLNQHAIGAGAAHARGVRMASLTRAIGGTLGELSFAPASPSVVVMIPADDTVANAAPVDEPAADRHQDAVTVTLVAPPAMPALQVPLPAAVPRDPAPQPKADVTLASLTPADVPNAEPIAPVVHLPPTLSVLPPEKVAPAPLSPAQRLHLQAGKRVLAESCLAKAVYFEARDQPFRGQVAVAQVVINRVFSPFYPNDVCAVIYQNAARHRACQFTFACDGRLKPINERGAWARARRIAHETLDGQLYVPEVGTATHYHAVDARPTWVHEMHRIAREGSHTFYRPIAWGSGANLPIYSRVELAARESRH